MATSSSNVVGAKCIKCCKHIHQSIRNRHVNCLQAWLVSDGMTVLNKMNENNLSPLMIASKIGDMGMVRLLLNQPNIKLEYDAKDELCFEEYVNDADGEEEYDVNFGASALLLAVDNNFMEIVIMLVEKGANVDATDNGGTTSLMKTCRVGHLPMLQYLLEQGADASLCDEEGNNALIFASSHGHDAVVKLLLDVGVDVHTHNIYNLTAVDVAKTATVKKILTDFVMTEFLLK